MTAEETRLVDVSFCKRRVREAQYFFEDMQQKAVSLSENASCYFKKQGMMEMCLMMMMMLNPLFPKLFGRLELKRCKKMIR
jgi:hypothetical protein